jgi:RNA polymerase sigma factor (TIGR02999 family)
MGQVESASDLDLGASSRTTEEFFQDLYSELRRIAASRMARERPGHTLQATALVNEVWLRLSQLRQQTWRDDDHFIAAASETMRRILVDRARSRAARKNGGALRRTQASIDNLEGPGNDAIDHLILDDHLARLARLHPEKARILELRFFAGLTMAQIAALTSQSEKTIQRHWAYARAWLYDSIQRDFNQASEGSH